MTRAARRDWREVDPVVVVVGQRASARRLARIEAMRRVYLGCLRRACATADPAVPV
jgi:hypothetical protein